MQLKLSKKKVTDLHYTESHIWRTVNCNEATNKNTGINTLAITTTRYVIQEFVAGFGNVVVITEKVLSYTDAVAVDNTTQNCHIFT